jgi:hypothetical protein
LSAGETRLVHVPQDDERKHEQHARVRVPGAPEIVPQRVVDVPVLGLRHRLQQADSSEDDSREHHQKDAGEATRFSAHVRQDRRPFRTLSMRRT